MLDKQIYTEYLEKKYKSQKQIEEYKKFFGLFKDIIAHNKVETLTDITETDINDFIKSIEWSAVEVQKAFDFLYDYVSFIQKEHPELNALASIINEYCLKKFEICGKNAATNRKKLILLIPDDVIVDQKCLGTLTNNQFVTAFRDLQKLIIKIYDDVEKSPFEWGYPDYYVTDGYYNRVVDFLFAFAFCGFCKNGILTVDAKKFFAFPSIKRHKKPELMIIGFEKIGLIIDGYDKKSIFFDVKCPANPNVITVLYTYVHELGESALHWSAGEMCKWNFSYRYIEDSATQKYETVFHTKMDLSSEKLREIQYWLHYEAEKFGYAIDISHPYEKGCIQYQKKSKVFLLVGEKEIDGVPTIISKVIFRDVLNNETEKVMELYKKFPNTFKSNCTLCNGSKTADSKCSMRICYDIDGKPRRNCAYLSFFFQDLILDDIKKLLQLFILENKIRL